ncbi:MULTISPECIES: hydantoinase/oxoprolinase family protein [unclassified Brevibacterium]|uniref:hydantoinase/oxoprolinase family protein n=1 Tax=unclassified Brevibacterium TaxID=2614124 RepID=UPI001E556758|nr:MULTISPECIES: hydantoinase/oxoprolinase family protein [unclassified Brevibacterium]MCD1286880.1 5-oxoprolinase [Brevibacterium sp. CCUG 69071]MDK8433882.1 hydantoinase/oxoprolinase family protein [Brevibacterium sp. H-BE7]
MSPQAPRIRIGIDTGGTFTDIVAFDETTGTLTTTKTPSTPSNPADGFINGIDKVLALLGDTVSAEHISAVSHGTTVATNQLLEGKLDRLGFITTEGYEFILEIARQAVPDGYGNSYFWVKPDRIVPADLVKTVSGRFDFEGKEVRPFDDSQAREVAQWFKDQGIMTLGVNFLHAYANPVHEQRMREILTEVHPDATVSLSSEVLREYREYERSMTTLVDAAVKPKVSMYVRNIHDRLDAYTGVEEDSTLPFYIMKSNGGVLSAEEVVHQPITTVLSGPAAGALGAGLIAREAGFDKVLTCDGGGTSTDVTVVIDGEPALTTEGSVGVYPSKIPMIDVVTVGAGGGSIAWTTPEGQLKVGPQSAGADPGPICYGNGGAEPTITDAHVFLGRIPPHLLGGEIPLNIDAAKSGIADIATRLGLSEEKAATGILEISAWNQANALRQVSVQRGLDVRDFMLTTFGGSGSLLACTLVDVLDLAGVVVPLNPGNVSAFGLLTVDVKNDYVQTHVSRDDRLDIAEVADLLAGLTDRATKALNGEGFPASNHQFDRSVDLRYFGQAFEVRVSAPSGPVTREWADEVTRAFHAEHKKLYGYDFADTADQFVEWVNLRVSGIGPITRPETRHIASADGAAPLDERGKTGNRPVCFDASHGFVDTPVYWREELLAGDEISGPAIIEEFGSTVPLHPEFTARIDSAANIIITRTTGQEDSK